MLPPTNARADISDWASGLDSAARMSMASRTKRLRLLAKSQYPQIDDGWKKYRPSAVVMHWEAGQRPAHMSRLAPSRAQTPIAEPSG